MKFTRRPEVLAFLILAIIVSCVSLVPTIQSSPVQAQSTADIVELRTENSKTWQAGANKFRVQIFQNPIHYKDNYGNIAESWKDIDLTIVNNKITKAPYELTIDTNSLTATVRDKRTGSIASITLVGIPPGQLNKANISVSTGQVKWNNILPDIDLAIVASGNGIQFKRIIKSATASKKATFAIAQSGNSIKVDLRASDARGKTIKVQGSTTNGVLTEDITDTDIVYPLEIDPTLTVQPSAKDATSNEGAPNANYGTGSPIYIRGDITGGSYRTMLEFSVAGVPAGATVVNATMKLYYYNKTEANAVGRTHVAYRITRTNWVENQVCWNNYTAAAIWTVAGGDYTTTDNATAVVPAAYGWMDWVVKNQVIWAVNNSVSAEFLVKDTDEIGAAAKNCLFYSREEAVQTTLRPMLVVDYYQGPTTATWQSTNVQNTTATLWGNVTASVGSNVTVRGFYYGSSSPPLTNVNNTGSWASPFSWSKNITTLSRGTKYYFKAFAVNAGGTGQGSELTFLTKPSVATAFSATAINQTRIDLSWVKGTGATNTYIVGKLGAQPANRTDGTLFVNSTVLSYSHSGLVAGQHWYYSAWGYTINGTLEQYSDTYAMSDATTLAPPTVTTGICSGFTTVSGIVNAGVTSEGTTSITQYGFEYGLTVAYGSSSLTTGNKAAGSTYVANLTGLTPSTTYHYRAKAYNGAWGYGADKTFTTKGSPALWESFNTGDNATFQIYQQNWGAQVITTNTTAHTVTSVRLKLFRSGNPGTVTVSMRYASGGTPTGVDLTSGTIDGNTFTNTTTGSWYTIDMTEYSQAGSGTYAIVVRAPNGSAASYVGWREASGGGYTGGSATTSTNSGVSWSAQAYDFMFEIWGNTCMEIQDVKVFSTYKTSDDWLFTVRYVNTFPPYYDTYDIKRYFSLQLLDTAGNVRAATTLPAWGNRVSSIYLSPTLAGALEWGAAYRIRIYGTFSGNPYTEYFLVASDWQGSDLTFLDSWVITSAGVIMDYYSSSGLSLTTYVAGRGEVLNATGGSLFDAGISGLSKYRPSIFQTYSTQGEYNPTNWDQGYRNILKAWQANIGTDGTVMATRLGNMVGMDGGVMLALFFVLAAIALAGWGFSPGHSTAACIMSMIPIMGGVFFGIDLIFIGIIVLIAAFIFVKRFWIDTGA